MDVVFGLSYHNWTQLPNGVLKPIPFCPIWGNDTSKSIDLFFFINNNISKYLEFWKLNIIRIEMYAKAIGLHIEYKEGYFRITLVKTTSKAKSYFVRRL